MRRIVVVVLLAAVIAGGLTACGRKGALEAPPESAAVEQSWPRAVA